MYVDACAIIALLSDEPEAERVSAALASAAKRVTSPVAILEAVLGLARPDKFGLGAEAVETIVLEFLEARGIEIRDLPPASARSPCLFRPRIAIAPGMVSISATACIMPAPNTIACRSWRRPTRSERPIWTSCRRQQPRYPCALRLIGSRRRSDRDVDGLVTRPARSASSSSEVWRAPARRTEATASTVFLPAGLTPALCASSAACPAAAFQKG
ncbi:type II toxin-antitoxin system VapC family toxin [Rhizobium sp. NFR03]|uniref:type II toxin-antitoxin system VapC family toxin n=1 Tax=Rhizobium sp. NFR03 TaxID=1566263 RepID=UPI001FCD7F45|nr:type II toxin-antitoxin system VapC family toxin [Rhizobium sp. NFR03]